MNQRHLSNITRRLKALSKIIESLEGSRRSLVFEYSQRQIGNPKHMVEIGSELEKLASALEYLSLSTAHLSDILTQNANRHSHPTKST